MRILVACEFSGVVRDAFIAKGHDAMSCDYLPTERPGPHYQGDVFDILYSEHWDMMIAHPSCQYLSHAGIGYFNIDRWGDKAIERHRLRDLSAKFFLDLYNAPISKVCIENPVGYMNSFFRKPDQIINPYFWGDAQIKPTCLWLKCLPRLIHIREDDLFNTRTHVEKPQPLAITIRKPSKNYKGGELKKRHFVDAYSRDPHIRSITFQGIADAMANQWG